MKVWHTTVAALVAFGLGCNKSPEGGTPGTNASFKVVLPTPSQDVKQGDTRTVDGSLDRGKEFKKDVKLKVESTDKKVNVKLTKDVIKAADADTKFGITISPEKDAPLAEIEVKVTGTPDGGGDATTGTFKVKVTDK